MLQMLRSATVKIATAARDITAVKPRTSLYRNYMCYQDGTPFMVINAPSLEHAQFIVAGFTQNHVWMLIEVED
ncbi:MAG: hypothetical protein H7Y60_02145 [Rhodospirillaceae bacterium]|nr:hypothetical protein [Rhodospirillales bacterium]